MRIEPFPLGEVKYLSGSCGGNFKTRIQPDGTGHSPDPEGRTQPDRSQPGPRGTDPAGPVAARTPRGGPSRTGTPRVVTMAEERKLKLKRRRGVGQPREPSSTPWRPAAESEELPATVFTWLEDNSMNEPDHIWALLMKSLFPDMKRSDWKTMSVPDFPLKSEKVPKHIESVATEAISVGNKSFVWTPFPPTLPTLALEGKSRSELPCSHGGRRMDSTEVHEGRSQHPLSETLKNKDESSFKESSKYLFTKENDDVQSKKYLENVILDNSYEADPVRCSAGPAVRKWEDLDPVDAQLAMGHKSTAATMSLWRIGQEPKKPRKGNIKQHTMLAEGTWCGEEGDNIVAGQSQGYFPDNQPRDASLMSVEEAATEGRSDAEMEGRLDLESCPMCLVQFPAGFTQLEVDSHLAKCLSESTGDVMWDTGGEGVLCVEH
ncbi:uncharacterized protein [Narcine bancroftii]|uniref:uncharacterized protein n=1 Tax=Narcine bancroftii TaxID=1343680 RepID=UPI003831F8D8